jgi:hypothetical protein
MRDWNRSDNARSGSSTTCQETPRRTRFLGANAKEDRKQTLPGSVKVTLPGFQNSFLPTSPAVSKRSRVREVDAESRGEDGQENAIDQIRPLASDDPSSSPPNAMRHKHTARETDIKMGDEIILTGDEMGSENVDGIGNMEVDGSDMFGSPFRDDLQEIEAPNWRQEVRFVLTVL